MPILLLVLGGLALFALSDDKDSAPSADCYDGLEPDKRVVAEWLLTAPAGFVIPGLDEEGWGNGISSDLLVHAAEECRDTYPQLSACLLKRAAVLKNQGH